MVEIVNISRHPGVVLPKEVSLDTSMNAMEFMAELCETYGADKEVVMKKRLILVDGARITSDSRVEPDSRIYILAPAVHG